MKDKLLIHFHEGDEYIKSNYPAERIVTLRDKLWVENPYMDKYPGIQYTPEGTTIFEHLLSNYAYNGGIDMIPVYVHGLDTLTFEMSGKGMIALYA